MKKMIFAIPAVVLVISLAGYGVYKVQAGMTKVTPQETKQTLGENVSQENKSVEVDKSLAVIVNEVNTEQYPKVQIFATVTKDGVPVKGLTAADFKVREDEVDQEPITVEPKLPPMSVMLTLDTSGSMSKQIKGAQVAAKSFLGTIGSNDSTQVVSFADEVKQMTTMSSNREAASAAIDSTVARGNTALYDGLYESIQLVKGRTGRKAIVLLSDGADFDDGTGKPLSKHTAQEVIAAAREANVPIYALGLGTEIDEAVLTSITKETGAVYFNAKQASDLNALYAKIGEQLAGQYAINYSSNLPADGTEHRMVLTTQGLSNTKVYKAPGTAIVGTPVKESVGQIPDWVPAYPFTDKLDNNLLRQGAGSFSFVTENSENAVRGAYAAKLKEVGWKVDTGYDGGYYAEASSPDGQRVVAVVAKATGDKTDVAVNFIDYALATSAVVSAPEGIPNWVPIYPGKVDSIRNQGNAGGFSITTTHGEGQARGLYAALLRAAGYKVETGYDGGYYARGTSDAQKRSIAVTSSSKDKVTTVTVMFEQK